MIKKNLLLITILVTIMVLMTGCFPSSGQKKVDDGIPTENFKTELELKLAVQLANTEYDLLVNSNQEIPEDFDICNLREITAIYRPKTPPEGMKFNGIIVLNSYMGFDYTTGFGKTANFSYIRNETPEEATRGLDRDKLEVREITKDGIIYKIANWEHTDTNYKDLTVHWDIDGVPFIVSFPNGKTDEMILEFCQFEKVMIEDISSLK